MPTIEEIRARAEKKLTGLNKYHGYAATKSSKHGDGVYDAIIQRLYQCEYKDIPFLLSEVDRLTAELARVTAERDAAVEDIPHICETCGNKGTVCLHCNRSRFNDPYTATGEYWQWHGTGKEGQG